MATANMEEDLTCSICLELYNDPRLLPCHHSICKSCLVALRSKQENNSNTWLQCPSCRHLFEAKDEAHIEFLPKNFTLASIVCKFRESVKRDNVLLCDVCEDDKKGRAIKKCLQCKSNYCRVCLEHLHEKTGGFASHKLVHIIDAYGAEHKEEEFCPAFLSSVSEIQSVDTLKCDKLKRERYCTSCDEIFTEGDQRSIDGVHEHHVTTEMRSAVKQKRKLKELQNEIGPPITHNCIQRATRGTVCDLLLPSEQLMNKNICDATCDICLSEITIHEPYPVNTNVSSNHANMAIQITKVQKDGTLFADVKWVSSQPVDHYEISYLCDPRETVLQRGIVETRCKLSTLKWNSEYTVRVTAYLPNGKTSFDSAIFKTDPKVKVAKPAIMNISPRRVKMSLNVTTIQKAGIMSADVKWTAKYEPCDYEVLYYCNPDEIIVLKNIPENRCLLTNLRWDSTYTVKVTTELEDGTRRFNEIVFKTDHQVKCFPMAASEVCNKQIEMQDSHDEFKASNKIQEWVAYEKLGKFSGIVITPVLTEDVQFWTMTIELSIFEEGRYNKIFLDFGIVPYCNLEHCCTLRYNREAYSCSVIQEIGRQFHLVFNNCSISEGDSYLLPLKFYQRALLCYGFLYDSVNDQFAVVDCLSQNVLHVFDDVEFGSNYPPIFAVCPYHTETKMRVKIKLDRDHASNQDVSSWMKKISNF
ncbi:hypothetical protein ACJMK2_031950 [Sinanodonta woodiana]|uniref:Uncharacterized protein n=1 Tax=Sinanodonta woodiana TaxID=1069815 RepID=A0ABD3X2E5_SINWO